MKRAPLVLLVVWIALLAILTWYVQRELVIGTDLRLFLPQPTTPQQALLLQQIGEGPGSRVLILAIEGAAPEKLADASRALAERLSSNANFRLATNGDMALDAIPDALLPYRYLLSPTLDTTALDEKYLQSELATRALDLSSPAGGMLEAWLPRDPTLELVKLLQRWQPMHEPKRLFDVWFDGAGQRALLIAETKAPAFDPDRQRLAIAELQHTFAEIAGTTGMRLEISGPGAFSVLMEARTRGEAQALGIAATVAMLVLLVIAYRRVLYVVLSALPLASAGIAGLFAVSALFGTVHGITLAFGFTLIGVAQDYPIHLLSHERPDRSALQSARALWPTLITGVASTCIAYLTFYFSGVIGLQQLACFTVVGLAVAALTTRFGLPRLIPAPQRDYGQSLFLQRLWQRLAGLPHPRFAPLVLGLICVLLIAFIPGSYWENDLSKLTPVPENLLRRDQELRTQLGSPDIRYLLIVQATDADAALHELEMLDGSLQSLIRNGAITGYDHAARYLPSAATQEARREKLPNEQALRRALQQALAATPFQPDAFEPFVADVLQARQLKPLTFERLREAPLGASVEVMLDVQATKTLALVTFTGVNDATVLQQLAATKPGSLTLLDLKAASEELVEQQRVRILWSLSVAAILLIGVIAVALREKGRVLRVLAPMTLTTLIVLAVLHTSGVPLNLFHLVALILGAGLGLDYALFFEHAADDAFEQGRTLHAVLICSISTLLVFALLGISSLPVLRAIGVTVSLAVICNFVLALVLTRPGAPHA
jgi:predicted exporter